MGRKKASTAPTLEPLAAIPTREEVLLKAKDAIFELAGITPQKIADLAQEIGDTESDSDDADAQGFALQAAELASALAERSDELKWEVEDALQRLRDGTLGQCQRCLEQITAERLEALPMAKLCAPCQRKSEEETY